MSENELRGMIRLLLKEGVFDGKMGAGKPTPSDPKEKSHLRGEQQKSLTAMLKNASTRLRSSIATIEDEVDEIPEEKLFDMLKEFPPNAVDKEMAARAAYSIFKISIRRLATPTDLNMLLKKNGTLRAAIMSVSGMQELQNAVNTKLDIMGKDPDKSVNEAWAILNEFIKQLSLVK